MCNLEVSGVCGGCGRPCKTREHLITEENILLMISASHNSIKCLYLFQSNTINII